MSRKGPFIVFRLIGLLFVIGLMVGGGMMAYRAGFSQGVAQSPAVAKAIEKAAESGQGIAPVLPMYGYGYGSPYGYGYPMHGYPHFGFFPLGGICFSIFFLFLFLGFMKMMFFRRMMWGGHYGGHHGPPWMHHHGWEEKKEGDKKDESPEEKK